MIRLLKKIVDVWQKSRLFGWMNNHKYFFKNSFPGDMLEQSFKDYPKET